MDKLKRLDGINQRLGELETQQRQKPQGEQDWEVDWTLQKQIRDLMDERDAITQHRPWPAAPRSPDPPAQQDCARLSARTEATEEAHGTQQADRNKHSEVTEAG